MTPFLASLEQQRQRCGVELNGSFCKSGSTRGCNEGGLIEVGTCGGDDKTVAEGFAKSSSTRGGRGRIKAGSIEFGTSCAPTALTELVELVAPPPPQA